MQPETIQSLLIAHKAQNEVHVRWWNRWMELYRGEFWGKVGTAVGDDEVAVDTNYTFGYLDSLVAGVVPAQPAVSITVNYPPLQQSRRAREALVNATFRRNGIVGKLRRVAGLSAICGTAYLKATWDLASSRVVFTPKDRRYVWVDPDAAEWPDVRYIIEAVPLTTDQFDQRVKRKGGYDKEVAESAVRDVYPNWGRADGRYDSPRDTISKAFYWVTVYEVYDFVEGKMYHVLDGTTKPLLEADLPYKFLPNRFHPITFNDSLANVFGVSDISLIYRLQMMLNELDTLQLQFAQSCIPIPLFDSSATDDPAQVGDDFANASGPRDMVDVPLKNGKYLDQVIVFSKTPPLNPEHADIRSGIMAAIENLLALPAWRRGEVGQAHIATEVAAAMSALQTRNGRRVTVIHEAMAWCARATMALTEEMLSADTVMYGTSVAGESVQITRRDLQAATAQGTSAWWDESYFAYKISSYDSPDDSLPVQLRALSQFLPTLIALPEVKRYALVQKLAELLSINPVEILWSEEKLRQMSEEVSKQLMAQQAGGAVPPGLDGKKPDGRMIPNGAAVALPGVSAGGEVAAPGMAGGPTPETLAGAQGGPGIGL